MSTELAILCQSHFSKYEIEKKHKCNELLMEVRDNIRHIKWCIEVVKISEFPVYDDIRLIQKTIHETQKILKKIKPVNTNQTIQLQNLNEGLAEANERMPSEFRIVLKRTFEILEMIFGCSKVKYKVVSQYDINSEREDNFNSKLLKTSLIQRRLNGKKNI